MRVITIGRSPENDVIIQDAYVGRIHMQIVLDDDGYIYAVDMNSTNGTYVNGQRIYGKVRLQKNDVIRIGNAVLPWETIIPPTTPIIHKTRSVLYIILIIPILLLLVCVGIYFWNINNTKESESIETSQNHNAHQLYNNVSQTEKIMGINEEPSVGQEIETNQNYNTHQLDNNNDSHTEKNMSINEKPSINIIPYDLIGHKLSEGVSDGYHRQDWSYTIEDNSIINFRVDEILTNDNDNYLIVASFHLKGGNNFYYDTRAKISYVNTGNGWKLNYVNSLGMFVVSDGQYDDCVICEIADDGWGGVNCLSIRNTSEYTLVVGGQIRTHNRWLKFSRPVDSHNSRSVGGTFGGGSVSDYIIEFVVREK